MVVEKINVTCTLVVKSISELSTVKDDLENLHEDWDYDRKSQTFYFYDVPEERCGQFTRHLENILE